MLIGASEAAWAIGQPYNRFVTVLWERGGVPARDVALANGRFIKLASDWMRQRGYRLTWAWVQEWGNTNGAHSHLLMHVPPDFDPLFRAMPLRWVKHILPGPYVAGSVQSQKIRGGFDSGFSGDGLAAAIMGKLHYVMKAAPADLEHEFGLCGAGYKPWGQASPVFGKRVAVWQGWKAVSKIGENREICL